MPTMNEITAKYDGKCKSCGNWFDAGDTIMWAAGQGALCMSCSLPAHKTYTAVISPPTTVSTPTADSRAIVSALEAGAMTYGILYVRLKGAILAGDLDAAQAIVDAHENRGKVEDVEAVEEELAEALTFGPEDAVPVVPAPVEEVEGSERFGMLEFE